MKASNGRASTRRDGSVGTSGAGQVASPDPGRPVRSSTVEVVYRGVRWRRSASGRTMWFNQGLRRWVVWSAGSDAPPLPKDWDGGGGTAGPEKAGGAVVAGAVVAGAEAPAGPGRTGLLRYLPSGNAMASRPSMRSPYRLVPLLVAALIVGVAVYQATRPAQRASAAEVAAAKALKGKCLARDGGPGSGTYSATPVACGSTSAAMKVVAVIVPGGGGAGFAASQCPRGSVAAQVLKPGVTGEPVECLEPVPS